MAPETSEWQALTQRVETLERHNRRLKQVAAMGGVLAAALLLMGQAAPQKNIEANAFILKDVNGKTRAFLGITPDGPVLGMYDAAGNLRTSLDADENKAGLRLLDQAGGIRAALAVRAEGPSLNLYDTAGKARASLATGAEGPALDLHDNAGKLRASLSESLAQPRLVMFGFGKQGAELTVDADMSHLLLSDPDGFEAAVGTMDVAAPRAGQPHRTSAASVVLFDKDKNVIWKAP